ncbi:MAG: MBOAT family protein [Salibacteraceae bacterium]
MFTTLDFWVFFLAVFTLFTFVSNRILLRNLFLFLASGFFYFKTSGIFLLLLWLSIAVGFGFGWLIYKVHNKTLKKVVLFVSVSFHLAVLCYFKYAYFFASSFEKVIGKSIGFGNPLGRYINELSGTQYFDPDKILLPVGISFFTFQILTYVIDIYREKLKPLNSVLDFGFYVSFFPQLVAGPIVRASDFIPQIHRPSVVSRSDFGMALFLVLRGLIKKIAIGDYLAVNFIDRVFAEPLSYTGFENIVALFAYSLQVYVDFSGYTDIAIGLSLAMGFRLKENFNSPYKATSVGDFWRRWHISLSHFLRDYLYIPLGGNRLGKFRTNLNLMITMLLGGLWHGASWNFVAWGGINGIGLLVYKAWKRISPYENSSSNLVRTWRIAITFLFITFTRIWFRAPTEEGVSNFFYQVVHMPGWNIVPDFIIGFKWVLAVMMVGYVLHWLPTAFKNRYRDVFVALHPVGQAAIAIVAVLLIYQMAASDAQPFIYFQF